MDDSGKIVTIGECLRGMSSLLIDRVVDESTVARL